MSFSQAIDDRKLEWRIPAGLIALGLIPVVAGIFRLFQLASGVITPENERFFAAPLPAVLHIVTVTLYSLLGAFQFMPGLRRRRRDLHRFFGRILVPSGLIAATSGLWMTEFYPRVNFEGEALHLVRLLIGVYMSASLIIGFLAIRRRDLANHRAWMMRAYAVGLGAGTQALTNIPLALFPSIRSEAARTLCMAAGWVINMVVAEILLRKPATKARLQTANVVAQIPD
jgi:uncharacterized membrane protein